MSTSPTMFDVSTPLPKSEASIRVSTSGRQDLRLRSRGDPDTPSRSCLGRLISPVRTASESTRLKQETGFRPVSRQQLQGGWRLPIHFFVLSIRKKRISNKRNSDRKIINQVSEVSWHFFVWPSSIVSLQKFCLWFGKISFRAVLGQLVAQGKK